ncbi:MAG TPA: hypothetical protein PKZ75_12880 [Bacteroidia bacterium]|nr:hypothetical protein [Bacteroidia bacterium]
MKINIFKEKLIWVILISLLIGVISFEVFRQSQSKFDNILNLLNAMATCLTFGITYLLFDKYGIKKNVVEKQFEAVIEIIQELKKIRILYEVEAVNNGQKLTVEFGQIFIRRDMSIYKQKNSDNNIDKKEFPVLFNVQDFYNGTGNLSKALTNIWLPNEIKENFEFLNIPTYTKPPNLHEINTISIAFSSGILKANPTLDFYFPNNQELTFGKLISSLETGLTDCENWIKTHAEHNFKLNI